jgi:outer membrane protein assembly factor BamE (lipoprotein component of BamABCDE complex)
MPRSTALLAALAVVVLQGCAITYGPRGPQRSDAMFAQVQQGMTRDDVMAITGAPDNTMAFPASRTDSWGYFYWDTWGYYCEYSVTFGPDGRVLSKLSRRISDGHGRD